MNNLQDWIALISALVPLLGVSYQIFKLVAQLTHNKKLINLSDRASIIVQALEQNTDLMNEDKKQAALQKLAIYAKEVGIKVTGQQLDDYIESAVRVLKYLNKDTTETVNIETK